MSYEKNNTTNKPKIIIAMNDFLVGGIQKLAIDQMSHLKDEYEFILISMMELKGNDFYSLVPKQIKIYKLNFKGFLDVYSWSILFRILKEEKPAIVKSAMFFSNTIFRLLKPFFSYKIITAEHNTEVTRPFFNRFVDFLLTPLTFTIVADSKTVAEFVGKTEHINIKKFSVIYNGVELDEIEKAKNDFYVDRQMIRAEMKSHEGEKIFLNVARLVLQKNHSLMISGFADYLKRGGKGKLVIIGDGKLKDTLTQQAKDLKIDGGVVFMGERKDIYRFYSASDYFVLTSIREGFCISAMNGLAFGLPLVSTQVAGVVEYLEDGKNGYFTENTKESVGKTLLKISKLSEEDLKNMKESAIKTASRFGVDVHVSKYRQLFNSCLTQ